MTIIAKFNVISILRWLSPLTVYLYGGVLHGTALYTLLPPRSLAQLSARVTRRCCTQQWLKSQVDTPVIHQ